MSIFYPITRHEWLRNKPSGFLRFVTHLEDKAVQRITKELTYHQKGQNAFLTDGDQVHCSAKVNVYSKARLSSILLGLLLALVVISEYLLNYQTFQIVIMPGQSGPLPLLMRVPSAITLTIASITLADMTFEMLFHNWFEQDKIKYNFPDSMNPTNSERLGISEKNRIVFMIISALGLVATLYVIYGFAEERVAVIEQSQENSGTMISPVTLLSLVLPIVGGLIMILIKKNYNIISAYKATTRYKRIKDVDYKRKNILVDAYTKRRNRIMGRELSRAHKRINTFRNFLEARNQRISKGKENSQEIHHIDNVTYVNTIADLKKHLITQLEPDILRYQSIDDPLFTVSGGNSASGATASVS